MARKNRGSEKTRRDIHRVGLQEQIRSGGLTERSSPLFISGIFLIHTLAIICLFVPWSGVFSSAAIVEQDWGLHFFHLTSLDTLWRQNRMVWGYNPFFMAGFPSNTIQDLSIKFFEFAALGLSTFALTPIQWFKILAFLAMAVVPWTMYFAAQNFFAGDISKHLAASAAALLGTISWWNSLPREMFFYGMIGFPAAAYFSVWGVSVFYRLAIHPGKFTSVHLAWLIFASTILPLHVQAPIIFIPPMVALLLTSPTLFRGRLIAWISAAILLSLVVNAIWLIPAVTHHTDDVSADIVSQLPLFTSANPGTFILDYLGPQGFWTFRPSFIEKGFRIALLVLGPIGVCSLLRRTYRSLGMVLACALVILFIFTYFGAFLPLIKSWQPLRFKVPLDLFLVIGAAYAIAQWLSARGTVRTRTVPVIVLCSLFTFLINLAQTESTGKLRLRAGLNPELMAVTEWIKRETPVNARVLFEESGDETGFIYDGAYLSSFLPHRTGRQLIGGPINLYNDRHHFAEFHSGKMFKKDAQSISGEELRNYLRLYNIGAVVAFHPASIKRLQSVAGLVTLEQRIGPAHLMKVNQSLTWFIAGDGKVRAEFNRLELSELTGREVILKYHWIEGLTASPPVTIEAVKMLDDPIPFIKLVRPPSSVSLRIGSDD
jgi:hypothetical protein